MPRAMVTGAAGFIGSHLCESLLDDGYEVIGIDSYASNYPPILKDRNLAKSMDFDSFWFYGLDLSAHAREKRLAEYIEQCETIFHLAGEPGVRESWGDLLVERYVRNNVEATARLMQTIALTGSDRRVIFASSSSIYGEGRRGGTATREDWKPSPISPYGAMKLAAENLVHTFSNNAVSLRLFTVYGPRQRPDMAVNSFIRAHLSNGRVIVNGDGDQRRDFTYIEDVVDAFRRAQLRSSELLGFHGGRFNITSEEHVSINEVLDRLEIPMERRVQGKSQGDPRQIHGSNELAALALGWRPAVEFADGLDEQIGWQREAYDDLTSTTKSEGR